MKVDLPVVQKQTAQDMATSRNIGAKVRLSAGSFVTSDAVNSGVASLPGQSNSSNIKVTRSGDITAETPVKLSFNADQVVALPAFPSANSPYAKSGIEIPVRVESVANSVNSLPSSNQSAPSIVPLPTLELSPLAPPAVTPNVDNGSSPTQTIPTDSPAFDPETSDEVPEEDVTSQDSVMSDESETENTTQELNATQEPNVAIPAPNRPTLELPSTPELPSNLTPLSQVAPLPQVAPLSQVAPLPQIAPPELPSATTENKEVVLDDAPVPKTKELSSKIENTPAPTVEPLTATKPMPAPSATTNTVVAAPMMSGVPTNLPNHSSNSTTNPSANQTSSGIPVTTGPLVITLGSTQMEADRAEKMQVESQAMRALQTKGSISKIHIVDGSVCRVVANGNRLFVVGDQPGETLVEVSTDNGAKPTYVKVCVVKPWQQASKSSVAVDQLASIVSHLVPDADVEVQPQADGSLLVKGMVESKEQAKKIVSSIRKMVLVPVIDALEIR